MVPGGALLPDSPYRDYYVWRDEPPADQPANVFPDVEDGVWFLDEEAGQYYLHNFYRHQPDLNTDNPAVRDEIAKLVGFWLQLESTASASTRCPT